MKHVKLFFEPILFLKRLNFSCIIDDAAILLQRKADYMRTKTADQSPCHTYRCHAQAIQRGQLPFHRNTSRLYFSRMEIDNTILDRELLTKFA